MATEIKTSRSVAVAIVQKTGRDVALRVASHHSQARLLTSRHFNLGEVTYHREQFLDPHIVPDERRPQGPAAGRKQPRSFPHHFQPGSESGHAISWREYHVACLYAARVARDLNMDSLQQQTPAVITQSCFKFSGTLRF